MRYKFKLELVQNVEQREKMYERPEEAAPQQELHETEDLIEPKEINPCFSFSKNASITKLQPESIAKGEQYN